MKKTRKVTYRRNLTPCIILEGKWLSREYGLQLGDVIDIKYGKNVIKLQIKK